MKKENWKIPLVSNANLEYQELVKDSKIQESECGRWAFIAGYIAGYQDKGA